MLNIFAITFFQPSTTAFEIFAKLKHERNNESGAITLIESSDVFGPNVLNVVVDMLNIFAIKFYKPSITVFEILAKNFKI